MNDIVRLKLIEIVTQYGQIVIENPSLVKGLLRDFCGDHKREINGLMDALHEGVPLELRAAGHGTPPALLLARLTRRLIDDRSMVEEMARWAVESWAMALGVLPQDRVQTTNPVRGSVPVRSPQPGPAFIQQMLPPATQTFTQGFF